jgi:hypothetical protein
VRLSQHLFRPFPILDVCGMHSCNQEIAFGVSREMALAAIHLLATIEATFPAR